ncbi:hypothetical protein GCM10022224_065070 [Nonomuraea antimicrobica]|uniref:Major Facilitator Superfamily protein n=1 Tax=Nonomuraea antimicrobica TaxID=561173 RepID=A0ABP7CKC6_9ACTN
MLVTFIYMATFGVLPYFLTVLLQSVHGHSALQSGLAFLIPLMAIATGERLATRIGTRPMLLIGFAVGIAGTAVLVTTPERSCPVAARPGEDLPSEAAMLAHTSGRSHSAIMTP